MFKTDDLDSFDVVDERTLEIEVGEIGVVSKFLYLAEILLEMPQMESSEILNKLQMLKHILIQPPALLQMYVLQKQTTLGDDPQILVFEVAG